jgi:mannose-6-phosphate isomerase
MGTRALYPLAFEPIYQYRLWGGRRLADWLKAPLPGEGPIGEAWLLSDRDGHASRVANGPLKGLTIGQLIGQSRAEILGRLASRFQRFPLLLKFLDVREMLSVQVHPPDEKTDLIPQGDTGKTEAWVVLEAEPGSRVYAGLKPGTTAADLRSLSQETANDHLASFAPLPGQSVLITAGTVHALGEGIVVFEVQENSDVTFRLYDWAHIDPRTGKPRALQVDQALACVDFAQGPVEPVTPVIEATEPVMRERLVDCRHFRLWRLKAAAPFTVGAPGTPSVVVCIDGAGQIEYKGADFGIGRGEVVLLPAALGPCRLRPESSITLLETAVPDNP